MDIEFLDNIVRGQAERNVLDVSINEYLSRCGTMTRLLFEHPQLREQTLEHDNEGNFLKHTGLARKVYKLKLPMSVENAKILFALISVDPTLPRAARGARQARLRARLTGEAAPERVEEAVQGNNPGESVATVCSQTYQNYKSALKWWHKYERADMAKVGYAWPAGMDDALRNSMATYKRDIAKNKTERHNATERG